MRRWFALGLTTLGVVSCSPGEGKIAYVGGNLWNGTGERAIADAVIIVAGGHIEAAGSANEILVPRGATIVDVDRKWIIPGLIDSHAHTRRWMLNEFLRFGVTAVRDVGGLPDSIYALRDATSAGTILGPRLYVAGAALDATPPSSPTDEGVRTPIDARRAVGNRRLRNASLIMLSPGIHGDLFRAVMDEANALNLPVSAHLGKIDAVTAAVAGLHSIEHLSGVVEASYDDFTNGWVEFLSSWAATDSVRLDTVARRLAETGVVIVPTLTHQRAYENLQGLPGVTEDLPPEATADLAPAGYLRLSEFTAATTRQFQRGYPMQQLFVRRFKENGGLVLAGSGAPAPYLLPGRSLLDELALLVETGFTPEEALLAATSFASRSMEADSIGLIHSGGVADFLVLDRNPLADIANLGTIDRVVFKGTSYFPNDLR